MESLSELLIYDGQIRVYIIAWSICFGIGIATVIGYFIKIKFGAFIQKLLDSNANSPETAVSLADLGLQGKLLVKLGLKSSANYKNILVAVTSDGKYYANSRYTSEPPAFKTYTLQHRLTRIERIELKKKLAEERAASEKAEVDEIAETEVTETVSEEAVQAEVESENTPVKTQNATSGDYELPPEKVRFDVSAAKYYIPDELRDRAGSIFFNKPTKFIIVLLALVALGFVAYFAEAFVNAAIRFFEDIFGFFAPNVR